MKAETLAKLAEKRALIYVVDPVSPGYLFAGHITNTQNAFGTTFVDLKPYVGLNIRNGGFGGGLFGATSKGEDAVYKGLIIKGHGVSDTSVTSGFKTHEQQARRIVKIRKKVEGMPKSECKTLDEQFKEYLKECKSL